MPPPLNISKQPDYTFALANAGQAKALMPVMKALDLQGHDYYILAEGVAKAQIQTDPQLAEHLAAPQQAVCAKSLVTGLSAPFQQKWADWFQRLGRPVVGYYDDFRINPKNTALYGFLRNLSVLIVPSRYTANALKAMIPPNVRFPILPLGQPVIRTTAEQIHQSQPGLIMRQLGLNPQRPTCLIIGDNASGFPNALKLLSETAKRNPQRQFLLALHPASDGQTERHALEALGWPPNLTIAPKSIDTAALLALPGVVLAHQSNLALMACVLGKPVIYIGALGDSQDESPDVSTGVSVRLNSVEAILEKLESSQQRDVSLGPLKRTLSQILGIPTQATQTILNLLNQFSRLQALTKDNPFHLYFHSLQRAARKTIVPHHRGHEAAVAKN